MNEDSRIEWLTKNEPPGIERIAIDGLIRNYEKIVEEYEDLRGTSYVALVSGINPYTEQTKQLLTDLDSEDINLMGITAKLREVDKKIFMWDKLSQFVIGHLHFVMRYINSETLENPNVTVDYIFK